MSVVYRGFCILLFSFALKGLEKKDAEIRDNKQIIDKVILITGASRGVGLSLTKQLLEEGFQVIAVARTLGYLEHLQKVYSKQLEYISADLSNASDQLSVAPAVGKRKLDYIVHNAAIIKPLGKNAFLDASHQDIRKIFEVNVIAPMILTNQLSNNMKPKSRVLFVSSTAGDKPYPGIGPYCVSKVAIDRYAESLQIDSPHNILAASVHPGDIDTDMQSDLRDINVADFAHGRLLKDKYEEGKLKLLSPDISALFLKWLLLKTSDQDFIGKKHNIYDVYHHPAWSNGILIKNPFE